ncbi:hypothetical protein MANY_04920 [Mycolicibacterium anyangense]|jgi:aminoglycoside/choline kinase family phosphotransferase|uniref:Aminoglycoside phosphotransferase n=1 Tax=Mycolicibacterium anyangense TaxID=1431246 RepID=A0A6N4W393_9MYCO|nr:phosphotransferase [Mycolicibacterium anyangense]BBZ75155.1 hypothetical protein MANY_04920 [Mycolicibacterium anyangense]
MSTAQWPRAIDDITAPWLTAKLRESGALSPTDDVVDVRPEPIGEGVGFLSHLFRLHLTQSGNGPSTVVVKLPTSTDYLQLAMAIGAYKREIAFYADVAPSCPLRTPAVHAAEINSEETEFVLLIEDLGHLENGDHLAGIPYDRARAMIDQLAMFHGWAWNRTTDRPDLAAFEPIDSPRNAAIYGLGIAAGWETYRPKARVPIPAGVPELIANWSEMLPTMLTALAEPATVVNGDLRVDNLFFDADGSATIVDFQMTLLGAGIWDVAYLVGQGMTIEERGGRERELVRRYVDDLNDLGIAYPFTQAWRQFQLSAIVQLTMPLTAGTSWDQLNDRAHELLHALNERALAIIADTDALSALAGLS